MSPVGHVELNPNFFAPNTPSVSDTEQALGTFGDMINGMIDQANLTDASDQQATADLITGNVDDLHTVLLAAERAEIALQLTANMRNRILESYNEVMRMQV